MPVERREQVTRVGIVRVNGQPEELDGSDGRRQPSMGGTSRVSREAQARICDRLGVKFPGPTRRWETGRRFGVSARAPPRLYPLMAFAPTQNFGNGRERHLRGSCRGFVFRRFVTTTPSRGSIPECSKCQQRAFPVNLTYFVLIRARALTTSCGFC